MNYSTDHTIYLQDGSLFNFKKRFKKHSQTLIQAFSAVVDGRSKFGKRHPLSLVLIILFSGITCGNTTIKDCRLWAHHNRKWLKKYFDLSHGIPDERTLSRAIQRVEINSLVHAYLEWETILYGYARVFSSNTASFDGKTMHGVHGKDRVRHILSLFSHTTHQILGQIGVSQKENEIPAFRRLLQEQQLNVSGMLLVGDALHTQQETIKQILLAQADYLLFVKGNQETLFQDLELHFSELKETSVEQAQDYQLTKDLNVITEVYLTTSTDLAIYLSELGWKTVKTVGKIKRLGTRVEKDQRTGIMKQTLVAETLYFISSQDLTAKQALRAIRHHWCIENNLHWTKDYLFLEDRCTLRSGNAPQVMTFLRSMCLSLFNLLQFISPTETISNFEKNSTLHHNFLRMAGVV